MPLLQGINDAYFDSDQESSLPVTEPLVTSDPKPTHLIPGTLAVEDGPNQPLPSLVQVHVCTLLQPVRPLMTQSLALHGSLCAAVPAGGGVA